jgi:hypothetical protein
MCLCLPDLSDKKYEYVLMVSHLSRPSKVQSASAEGVSDAHCATTSNTCSSGRRLSSSKLPSRSCFSIASRHLIIASEKRNAQRLVHIRKRCLTTTHEAG